MLHQRNKTEVLTLEAGTSRCEILPTLGGAIGAWTVNGQAMLRAAGVSGIAQADPFAMASFPLVPYSNRIGNGEFTWDERRISLAPNFFPEPHSIHGVGFEHPWEVAVATRRTMDLHLAYRPGAGWPWAFDAHQRITLEESALRIEMRATNLATEAVPLAFGHHPYFPRRGAALKFKADGVWLVGCDGLPSLHVKPFDKFNYTELAPVTQGDIDHCFTGWDGVARIEWQDQPLALEIAASRSLPHAVVCIRSDVDDFCFEPVPHVNDALNRREPEFAMPVVAPGASFTATIRFDATPR